MGKPPPEKPNPKLIRIARESLNGETQRYITIGEIVETYAKLFRLTCNTAANQTNLRHVGLLMEILQSMVRALELKESTQQNIEIARLEDRFTEFEQFVSEQRAKTEIKHEFGDKKKK
jgi:hypothetical protein